MFFIVLVVLKFFMDVGLDINFRIIIIFVEYKLIVDVEIKIWKLFVKDWCILCNDSVILLI